MDEERRIRFLVPPLFLIGSLLWGLACDPDNSLQDLVGLKVDDLGDMLGLLASGSIIVVTFGFLLGTMTVFVLRTTCRVCYSRYHEVVVSPEALGRIWDRLAVPADHRTNENELYAGAAFDHETMKNSKEGIHLWLMRRWNAFNVSATSTTALVVSVIGGVCCLDVSISWKWILPVSLIIVLFVWSAFVSHRDTMRMIEFQANRS